MLTAEKAPTNRTSGSSAVVGNFGYFYENSPIIAYDGEEAPRDTIYDFVQSTVPGCRTPQVFRELDLLVETLADL